MQFNEYLRAEVELKLKPSTFTPGAPSPPFPSSLPPTCTGSQYNQTSQQQLHKMTKNEVAMCVCVCVRDMEGVGKGVGDEGSRHWWVHFTEQMKRYCCQFRCNKEQQQRSNERTNERTSDKTKQTAYMMATKKPRGELYLLAKGEEGHRGRGCKASEKDDNERDNARLHNNKAKQQQIACPSALDATQYTHSYLLLSGSRCSVKGWVGERGE